jgi:hypothetical protein
MYAVQGMCPCDEPSPQVAWIGLSKIVRGLFQKDGAVHGQPDPAEVKK